MKYVWTVFLWLLPCLCGGEETVLMPSRTFYDKSGQVLREMLSVQHTYYEPAVLEEISPWLVGAVVAAEDKRFYVHSGVDIAAVLRAVWQNTQQGEVGSGATTISQQLARAISPRPKTLWGKTKEAVSALVLEQQYSKEEILEQYFNRLEFGNLTQGVQAASRYYFSIDAADVSLSQAAFLAGILKSPTYYNPLRHFSRALERRNYVLSQMLREGFIDKEMYELALAEQLQLRVPERPFEAPHFTQWAASLLPAGSTRVYTTLDRELQKQVEHVIANQLPRLADAHVTQAAVVVLDNTTGDILAYAGSADFNDTKHSGQVDGVRALRQPGSALKPFVYELAFEKHTMTPAALVDDTDTFFEGGFRPRNYDESFHGAVSVRTALACSYNIPAVKAAETVGTSALLEHLRQLGFASLHRSADFYGLGLSLGNGEVRLLELANAYATLARGGIFRPHRLVVSPEVKLSGHIRRVMDEKTAYQITDILKDNQARTPAFGVNSVLAMPFEMAAKTGTSKDYKDNFAIGYTPRWTVGVWVGNFDASSMQKVSGITGAGPILRDVALAVQERYPAVDFAVPQGLVHKTVCSETGLLAGPACAHTRAEWFDRDRLPDVCDGQHTSKKLTSRIQTPTDGDIFYVDPAMNRAVQQLKLTADCATDHCQWHMDAKELPDSSCQTWWLLQKGKHTLSLTCQGQSHQIMFEVVE